jgi:hypothetical protein
MADLGTDPELIIKKAELQIKKIEMTIAGHAVRRIELAQELKSMDEGAIVFQKQIEEQLASIEVQKVKIAELNKGKGK